MFAEHVVIQRFEEDVVVDHDVEYVLAQVVGPGEMGLAVVAPYAGACLLSGAVLEQICEFVAL